MLRPDTAGDEAAAKHSAAEAGAAALMVSLALSLQAVSSSIQ